MIDTTGPYHAAYAISVVILIGYILSIWLRARQLNARAQERLREHRPR